MFPSPLHSGSHLATLPQPCSAMAVASTYAPSGAERLTPAARRYSTRPLQGQPRPPPMSASRAPRPRQAGRHLPVPEREARLRCVSVTLLCF
uniref:Uncharacterized protein n=1 Tax=Arundo donax TaxID=35708 RepID=A0A0A9B5C5_ARUDO